MCTSISTFFLTAQHSAPYAMARFYSRLVHFAFNFVGMFLSHITRVVPSTLTRQYLHCCLQLFSLLRWHNNEPRYLNVYPVFTSLSWMVWSFLGIACTLFFLCVLLVRYTEMSLTISLVATQILLYYCGSACQVCVRVVLPFGICFRIRELVGANNSVRIVSSQFQS